MSACAELVNGANQLAQNAALGMAVMCGHGAAPLPEAPCLYYMPRPVVDFSSVNPDRQSGISLTAMSFRLDLIGADKTPEKPGERAIQAMREWALKADAQSHTLRKALFSSGSQISGGYIFFDDADSGFEDGSDKDALSDIKAVPKPERPSEHAIQAIQDKVFPIANTDANDHLEPDTLSGTGVRKSGGYVFFNDADSSGNIMDAPVISGEVGSDVSGDTKSGNVADDVSVDANDLQAEDYSLSPDMLLSRGGITVSGGYSSVEGFSIGGKIARQNIGGTDRDLSASARYSKVRQLFEVGYADGHFLGSRLGFAPTLFAQRTLAKGFGIGLGSTPFAQSSYGFAIQFNRTFKNRLTVKANYRLSTDALRMRGKNSTCDASFFGSPICNALGDVTNSLLSISLALDRRQLDGVKVRGYRFRLAQDVGLGGSAPYSKTRIGGEAHIGLGSRWTLQLDAEAGYMAPIGKKEIPLFDRFYAGDTSLRGFDLRGVGPKVQPTGAGIGQNVAIGGRTYYAASAELSVSVGGLFEKFGLQPSLFVDAGSVFGAKNNRLLPGEQLLGNSAKPRVSGGVGLSMKTPAGTLRLDYARALVKQPFDRTQSFSISFGAAI